MNLATLIKKIDVPNNYRVSIKKIDVPNNYRVSIKEYVYEERMAFVTTGLHGSIQKQILSCSNEHVNEILKEIECIDPVLRVDRRPTTLKEGFFYLYSLAVLSENT